MLRLASIRYVIGNHDADLTILLEESLRELHRSVFDGALLFTLGLLATTWRTDWFIRVKTFAVNLVRNRMLLHNKVNLEYDRV